jgi:hypothetical protein
VAGAAAAAAEARECQSWTDEPGQHKDKKTKEDTGHHHKVHNLFTRQAQVDTTLNTDPAVSTVKNKKLPARVSARLIFCGTR